MLKNEKATKENINLSLQKLYEDVKTGDYLFLHFSCHGQQMMDLNGDEEDGLDEALVPCSGIFLVFMREKSISVMMNWENGLTGFVTNWENPDRFL